MKRIKWGGLVCAGCGNNDLDFHVMYTGADWNCEAGEGSGYDFEVSLVCDKCGRIYTIGHVKSESDISPVKQQLE